LTAANVTQLLALTPPSGPWRKKLADSAVKWSTSGGCPTGDPALHHYLGDLYYKGKSDISSSLNIPNASPVVIPAYSSSGAGCAEVARIDH